MLGFGLSWAGICGVRLAAWYLYGNVIYSPPPANSSLTGEPSISPLPATLRPLVASEPANLIKLHGKGNKWIHEGESSRARFALRRPADESVLKRRARPQGLTSRAAYKPAEQERLYFHLNADRAVRRHVVPDRALETKGIIKCKDYHRLRDQQGMT